MASAQQVFKADGTDIYVRSRLKRLFNPHINPMGKAADFVTSQGFAFLLYNENRKVLVLIMKELLISIVNGLVEDKEAVKVDIDEPDAEGVIVYHLHVAPDDMGRVIGKQGRIAKAIRTVMRAGAGRQNQKIMVEID